MKQGIRGLTIWMVLGGALAATLPTAAVVMECGFSGTNRDDVFNVYCQVGYATVFEMPAGRSIQSVVIGDPQGWRAESNGIFCFVSPHAAGTMTSLSVIDDQNRLYAFNLVERSLHPQKSIVARVKISVVRDALILAPAPLANALSSPPAEKDRASTSALPPLIESGVRYQVKRDRFHIERVWDDRVFTFIQLGRAQERPAIFYSNPKEKLELEPVKYVDKGDHYVVHKVLVSEEDRLVLKLGQWETTIRRR